ncbi:MAG: hypothetical protein CAF41_006170 [Nitrospira sp. CG24A]|nr:MAG: hypothetical protein CAF41_006170 [Nitrospira sp. CG24A]
MMRSARSRHTVLVAGLVALVYASLAFMAAGCALRHIDPSNGHTHQSSHETAPHNALCAWACQATSDAGLTTESASLATELVVRLVVSSPNQETPSLSSSLLRSRAPPSGPFVPIG